MKLSKETAGRINQAVDVARFTVQWGFLPFVIYCGFRQGADPMPNGQVVPLTLMSLLWG